MRVASLFSGIGGLDLGLKQAGHEIILQCESDPGAQQVLKHHFPGVLLLPDVCALTRLPKETDLLAAGFPCVDISSHGLRKGFDGPASGLIRHVFRLLQQAIADHMPVPWVLLENVEGLLDRLPGGSPPCIKDICDSLELLGYASWAHRVVCTAGFGLPNRRKRVFVVASWYADARDVLLSQGRTVCVGACCISETTANTSDTAAKIQPTRCELREEECGNDVGNHKDQSDARASDRQPQQGSGLRPCYECFMEQLNLNEGDLSTAKHSFALDLGNARSGPQVEIVPTFTTCNKRMCLMIRGSQLGTLRIEDAERLQGFEEGYTLPCYPIRMPGVSYHKMKEVKDCDANKGLSARWTLLANAVSVPVGRWLGTRLMHPFLFKYITCGEDSRMPACLESPGEIARQDSILREDARCLMPHQKEGSMYLSLQLDWLLMANRVHPVLLQQQRDGQDQDQGNSDDMCAADPAHHDTDRLEDQPKDAEQAFEAHSTRHEGQHPAQPRTQGGGGDAYTNGRHTEREEDVCKLPKWPRCAWRVKGSGRWGVRSMSDCPVKFPFIPLSDFIRDVGVLPDQHSLTIYLQRMKGQGWMLHDTIRQIQRCGGKIPQVVSQVSTLPGAADQGMKLGTLVWAPHSVHNKIWWPAQLLDPKHLPPGVTLLPQHLSALPFEVRQALVPTSVHKAARDTQPDQHLLADAQVAPLSTTLSEEHPNKKQKCGTLPGEVFSLMHTTADQHALCGAEGASNSEPTVDPPSLPTSPGSDSLKILVIFFPDGHFEWLPPSATKPFQQEDKETVMDQSRSVLLSGRYMKHLPKLAKAFEECCECLILKQAGSAGGCMKDSSTAALAQAARSAVNIYAAPDCGKCMACVTRGAHAPGESAQYTRKCLLVRAHAAAVGGHQGAQLAVLGARSVGTQLKVYWPLDEKWYPGQLTAFDPMRIQHTVVYDDGDVELLQLWHPQQLVQVLQMPHGWGTSGAGHPAADSTQHDTQHDKDSAGNASIAGLMPSVTAVTGKEAASFSGGTCTAMVEYSPAAPAGGPHLSGTAANTAGNRAESMALTNASGVNAWDESQNDVLTPFERERSTNIERISAARKRLFDSNQRALVLPSTPVPQQERNTTARDCCQLVPGNNDNDDDNDDDDKAGGNGSAGNAGSNGTDARNLHTAAEIQSTTPPETRLSCKSAKGLPAETSVAIQLPSSPKTANSNEGDKGPHQASTARTFSAASPPETNAGNEGIRDNKGRGKKSCEGGHKAGRPPMPRRPTAPTTRAAAKTASLNSLVQDAAVGHP